MQFKDVLSDIEKLVGKQLQSVNPNTASIYLTKIDYEAKKYFVSSDLDERGDARSFWELEDIWSELKHKGFSNVDQALYGSGSSRNQPETVFANLPYVQHFKYKNRKHILLRGKHVHQYGTLSQVEAIDYNNIIKKVENYFQLSTKDISLEQTSAISILKSSLDTIIKKYPGDLVVKDVELAISKLTALEKQTRDAIVTVNNEFDSDDVIKDSLANEYAHELLLPIENLIEDESFTGLENEVVAQQNDFEYIYEKKVDFGSRGKVKIRQLNPTLSLIFDRLSFEEIELQPDFQRKDRIWPNDKKSKLIESILMGLPLPVFYFAEKNNGDWVVVDGLQRITTIFDYMSGLFNLAKLEVLENFNGQYFRDLDRLSQRKIREYAITAHLIDVDSDRDNLIVELFHRINTYGVMLSSQEIRSAMNLGSSIRFLRYASSCSSFLTATNYQVKPHRQKDMELCLSVISFMIFGYKNFNYKTYDSFMTETMQIMNKNKLHLTNFEDIDSGKALVSNNSDEIYLKLDSMFRIGLDLASDIFGEYAFKKKVYEKKGPISKPLFEVIVTTFSMLNSRERTQVEINSDQLIENLYDAINRDATEYATWESEKYEQEARGFLFSISTSTGKSVTINYRFDSFINILRISTGVNVHIKPLVGEL